MINYSIEEKRKKYNLLIVHIKTQPRLSLNMIKNQLH